MHLKDMPLWYPYAQMKHMPPPFEVNSANGVYLDMADGRRLIDGISSWWCVIHGYNHPELTRAAKDQLDKMAHVMLGGLTHKPAQNLAEKLVEITPEGLNHVFFADSGSVGIEIAIKMAVQYWKNHGKTQKQRILSLKKAYHGDTTGAMSICDPEEGMHSLFSGALLHQHFVDAPKSGYPGTKALIDEDLDSLEACLQKNHNEIAAFIVEPVMQAAGGFNFYSPEYLTKARKVCDNYNVLLVFDEVATGFGRTGTLFAAEQTKITPDIMVIGKGLTCGYTGHAAVLASTDVFKSFYSDDPKKAFMHGPTFMGNPLFCAIALKGIELWIRDNYLSKIKTIEKTLKSELLSFSSRGIRDIRVLGATGVIEVDKPSVLTGITQYAADNGVWIRPFNTYLYTMPPYIINEDELMTITSVMKNWFIR
ncbi:adenosylmethionine--8-amino-7-oxononanoate transaminase [Thermoproteota archaeon]